jgi:hypothetical protein
MKTKGQLFLRIYQIQIYSRLKQGVSSRWCSTKLGKRGAEGGPASEVADSG